MFVAQNIGLFSHALSGITNIFISDKVPKYLTVRLNLIPDTGQAYPLEQQRRLQKNLRLLSELPWRFAALTEKHESE